MTMTWPPASTPFAATATSTSTCSFPFLSNLSRHSFPSSSSFFFPAKRRLKPYPNLRIHQLGLCSKKSEEESSDDLESELLEFMERSKNPNAFPTKEELIVAGRADLAVAVAKRGGWFTLGWDMDPYQEGGESRVTVDSASASSSGRSVEMEEEEEEDQVEEMGIGGILRRLERQRQLLYRAGSVEKRVNVKRTLGNGEGGESAGGDTGELRDRFV